VIGRFAALVASIRRLRVPLERQGFAVGIGASTLALFAIGFLFVDSTTRRAGEGFPSLAAILQGAKFIIGLGVLGLVVLPDYRALDRWAYRLYAASLVLLVAVLFLAPSINGAQRWFDLGFITLQPSEIAKVSVILALARYLKFRSSQRRAAGLIVPFAIVLVPALLIVKEPDLGTALMLPPILFVMLYVAGARPLHLALVIALGAATAPVIYRFALHDYQRERIVAYFHQGDPEYMRDEAFHYEKSKRAVAIGGIFGEGLGNGRKDVPVRSSDFIFACIGEEWGLVGATAVLGLYLLLILFCAELAMRTREPFGRLVVIGVAANIGFQVITNAGMTVGLMPIAGLTLPLISNGGSSLLATLAGIGLILNVALRHVIVLARDRFDPEPEEA